MSYLPSGYYPQTPRQPCRRIEECTLLRDTFFRFLQVPLVVVPTPPPNVPQPIVPLPPPTCQYTAPQPWGIYYGNFTLLDFVANDGTVTATEATGLSIVSNPFTASQPQAINGSLDHYKYIARTQCAFAVRQCSELYVEGCVAAETFGTTEQPFNGVVAGVSSLADVAPPVVDPLDDVRLASGLFGIYDPSTWLEFDFLLTNKGIYAHYARLPYGRPTFGGTQSDYHAFHHVIKLQSRNQTSPSTDFAQLGIGYDPDHNAVKWYIGGEEVFKVTRPGIGLPNQYRVVDYGGPDTVAYPTNFYVIMGTADMLDAHRPNNLAAAPNDALVKLSSQDYVSPLVISNVTGNYVTPDLAFVDLLSTEDNRIFGQGAQTLVRWLKVSTRALE